MDEVCEVSDELSSSFVDDVVCKKNKAQCSKSNGHRGPCNHERKLTFWKRSPILINNQIKELVVVKENLQNDKQTLENKNLEKEFDLALLTASLSVIKEEKASEEEKLMQLQKEKEYEEQEIKELQLQYEKLRILLEQKGYARKRRENTATNFDMINKSKSSARYRRQHETKNILEFIHGGEEGAIFGAWDFLSRYCKNELMEQFLSNRKRGKFLQTLYGKFSDSGDQDAKLKKAVATKYLAHLSRRRYNLICKVQNSTYNPNEENISPSSIMEYNATKIDIRSKQLSSFAVDQFVNSLDIGELHQIPGYSGVTRTVTALITMIAEVNLKIKKNCDKLVWFNDNTNHFIVEFSDDGAPESREKSMTIGSLTLWNFGKRVRSREFHYPLHMISTSEKDEVCESLWLQHSDEMALIESNVFHIGNNKVTFEFQPSADQSWQCWAANVLPSSATYPSPYANVHKSQLQNIGCTIGHAPTDTWKPPTMASMAIEITKLEAFRKTLPLNISPEAKHQRELDHMAENGMRQTGKPRIGIFADRIRPEPLHLEVNNWGHVLNLIYLEAVRRDQYKSFSEVMKNPVNDEEKPGCGLKFVGDRIDEHYKKESDRMKTLPTRLIGAQAISLARYSHRLMDAIDTEHDQTAVKIKHLALSQICLVLRDIGGLLSKVDVSKTYADDIEDLCTKYFNVFSLFFPKYCQSTVWTLSYAVPYHARKLYNEYGIGYGIISMQGKESLHSALKLQLRTETNRSIKADSTGKWHQIMRSCYVRNFYLPYHFPGPDTYYSHYSTRKETFHSNEDLRCHCSRKLTDRIEMCQVCLSAHEVVTCARNGCLSDELKQILKPIKCRECDERFADFILCDNHVKTNHRSAPVTASKNIVPAKLTIAQLKVYLKERNCPITGNKDILCRRLESVLSRE